MCLICVVAGIAAGTNDRSAFYGQVADKDRRMLADDTPGDEAAFRKAKLRRDIQDRLNRPTSGYPVVRELTGNACRHGPPRRDAKFRPVD
jgi:hypothetical protein